MVADSAVSISHKQSGTIPDGRETHPQLMGHDVSKRIISFMSISFMSLIRICLLAKA